MKKPRRSSYVKERCCTVKEYARFAERRCVWGVAGCWYRPSCRREVSIRTDTWFEVAVFRQRERFVLYRNSMHSNYSNCIEYMRVLGEDVYMGVNTSMKRKRVVLTLKEKREIIEALRKGVLGRSLAEKYGVGASTICDIKKKSENILEFSKDLTDAEGNPLRKVMKKAQNEEVDQAVYVWFMQKRAMGQPISGPLLCQKALHFNARLGGNSSFRASTGWLHKFKKHHGIREIEIHGEKVSADESSASTFKDELKRYLDQEGYDEEFMNSFDETGLQWKALPKRSLASRAEDATTGCKPSKERVTVLICANSSGTRRIPLLLIGKSKKPKCFKHAKSLPVVYRGPRKFPA
ncbi:hypothetical protein M513_08469 [Trichuris suis]|uniref:HTH CENPB-type domain-containing protein n=1 Tax=Trichuris suis TaxID=68888 RepID=A0A085M0B6_9BILA|nr:hypothetical protein M513_08469 [Trichuris suis]